MKRFLSLIFAIFIVASLSGCQKSFFPYPEAESVPEQIQQTADGLFGKGKRTFYTVGTRTVNSTETDVYVSAIKSSFDSFYTVLDGAVFVAKTPDGPYRRVLSDNGGFYVAEFITGYSDAAITVFEELQGQAPATASSTGAIKIEGNGCMLIVCRDEDGKRLGFLAVSESADWYFSSDKTVYYRITYSANGATCEGSDALFGS